MAQWLNNPPAMQGVQVRSLGQEDPFQKGTSTHSSLLAQESHGQRSLEGYSPQGHRRFGHDLATELQQ